MATGKVTGLQAFRSFPPESVSGMSAVVAGTTAFASIPEIQMVLVAAAIMNATVDAEFDPAGGGK